jgi:hypothetical protein
VAGAVGMGFGGTVNCWTTKGNSVASMVRVGLFTVNRARVTDSVVTESPSGTGSCPEMF